MQNQYGPSGKFTVFGSNVQRNDAKTTEFFKDANFPLYHQVRLEHAPCGRGIPHAVLFDHTGKVVKSGYPNEDMFKLIPDLVAAAPASGGAGPAAPILGDVQVKRCKSEAHGLSQGRPLAPILERLDRYAERSSAKGEEAKALAEAVRTYIDKESERLTKLVEKRPAYAALHLGRLFKRVKGLPAHEALWETLKPLVQDKELVRLVEIVKELEEVKETIEERGESRILDHKLKRIKKKLNDYIESDGPTDRLKSEAFDLAEEL